MTPTQAPRIITDAASAPATPIVEPQVNPNTLSPRQRGRQFLDAFLPRSRSRSSSASSRQSRSPDSVKDVIANLGLAAGTIGSEQIQQKSIHEEAIQGAKAFLSSIHNIIKRQGTGLENCVETIEVRDDALSEHNPITEVDLNPFGISTQPERVLPPKTELEDALFGADQRESQTLLLSMRRESSFTEDICVYEKNTFEKFLFRARLDTGMNGNFVKRSQAMLLGYPIEEYTGIPCIGINGSDYYPEGQVTLPFHFKSFHSARTWRVEFLVVTDDAPFDMALGIEFISHADLLRRTREALPVTFRKVDSREVQYVKHREYEAGYDSRSKTRRETNKYDDRREDRIVTKPEEKYETVRISHRR